ncbi:MAG TPA: prolipoprotein diacylglyceryl transferase [Clostridiales bacterium]|jgi:phosphatidylglycerol:prolipoprotein diacylglycerol transferase|nr:prolipoprotein diacylglyceryl transferase [Clostridiales bacterium]
MKGDSMQQNVIGFPGLGIEGWTISKVAFTLNLFGHEIIVAWYGVIITIAIVVSATYGWRKLTKANIMSTDDFLDMALWTVPIAVIGTRLYFVLAQFKEYFLNDQREWWEFLAIWQGGLAIYGGIIAGFFTVLIFCKIKKFNPWDVFDIVAPAVMLGQAIGRWANFMNAEAYGIKTTLPWRMSLNGYSEVHPTFLYESLWNIVGFIALQFVLKKKKFSGQVLFLYVSWYGLGRFWIERLRADSLPYGANFRVSQIVAGLCFVGGIIAYFVGRKHDEKVKIEEALIEAVQDELEENQDVSEEETVAVMDDESNVSLSAEDTEEKTEENQETEDE